MSILAPSILSSDFSNLSQQIRLTELGGANWIHCDVMDGQFVPNLTFGPIVVQAVNKITSLTLDVHLMINNVDNLINNFVNAGADYITVHQEAVIHLDRTINKIKELNCKVGVAINPSTPVNTLFDILEYVDMILIMSVNPGFGAQTFINNSLRKINQIAELKSKNNLKFLIEVDGGISKENILQIKNAGCEVFVAGSSIFNSENITASTIELKNLIL